MVDIEASSESLKTPFDDNYNIAYTETGTSHQQMM